MEFIHLSLEEIEQILTRKKIPFDKPGFYDHPNFLKEERKNSQFLEIYPAYVYKREYTEGYLKNAKEKTQKAIKIFSGALKRSKQLGACIDASSALSRILDRVGVWNFVVKGCVTMKFPSESNLDNVSFRQIDVGNYAAAHAWIFSPPFNVLDVTIKYQHYSNNEINYLPDYLASEDNTPGIPLITDIISPIALSVLGKFSAEEEFKKILGFQEVIKTVEFVKDHTTFRYIPLGMGLSDEPLEKINNIRFDGLYPFDFYMKKIKPTLAQKK